ncbi:hypothetical protein CR205_12090 [Alteribacter lacisalsi]|uniref:Uncharacterized protein n=1 Tax=Alteribacter lacisalsi TaxID=2045244 RepID=A0A2W0HGB4_9BACI|nr:hypothetical protein [Alteribacter lacisalsi]PYZ96455.1 hypothetical protein CR205_12090 [Alteribacter lacisalsi]
MKKAISYGAFVFLLAACGTGHAPEPENGSSGDGASGSGSAPDPDEGEYGQTDEAEEGDFVYRLVSEEAVYGEHEEVSIYAELEYTGDEDSIDIYHAASPFHFPMKETTRGYDLMYGMNQPLEVTTLTAGEAYREEFVSIGGYSEQDPDDYVAFMKEVIEQDGFPEGHYIVEGFADFYVETDDGEDQYKPEGTIEFFVED